MTEAELVARARAWRDADPDADDRAALDGLLDRADEDPTAASDLADAFAGGLQFGTAGLRGAMGPGPNRMNTAVVTRAAAGLAAYLTARAVRPLVVLGHDARHRSRSLARSSAAVLAAAGCEVVLLPEALPTPVLAFAVRHLGADGGVMVTASHNPAVDNGYKVYLGGRVSPDPGAGVQIVPPADAEIAVEIDRAPAAVDVPLAEDGAWRTAGPELVDAYVEATAMLVTGGSTDLRLVVTPMHGVGLGVLQRVLAAAGFGAPSVVAEQAEPDPDFPTVAFPNPEEAGALDLALTLAAAEGADLVLANDPDADRCSIAVADPARGAAGTAAGWRQLSGDEVGGLLAEHVLSRGTRVRSPDEGAPPALAASLVSSSLLHKVAAAHGVASSATLTGFKWIARTPGLVFGYEEALGYCVDPVHVRDKDGISAGLLLVELAARLRSEGRTLLDQLDDLQRRHGVHATAPVTLRLTDMSVVGPLLRRLVEQPPEALAGAPLSAVEDLSVGVAGLPGTPGVRLRAGDAARVVVRPSGTEPKLKAYLEVVRPVGTDGLEAARADAQHALDTLAAEVSALLARTS